jgi:hypothetical protein
MLLVFVVRLAVREDHVVEGERHRLLPQLGPRGGRSPARAPPCAHRSAPGTAASSRRGTWRCGHRPAHIADRPGFPIPRAIPRSARRHSSSVSRWPSTCSISFAFCTISCTRCPVSGRPSRRCVSSSRCAHSPTCRRIRSQRLHERLRGLLVLLALRVGPRPGVDEAPEEDLAGTRFRGPPSSPHADLAVGADVGEALERNRIGLW